MKTQMLLKGAVVAIVLFVGAALWAASSGVICEVTITDQYGEPISGVRINGTRADNTSCFERTDSEGSCTMTGLKRGTTVQVVPPAGYTVDGEDQSDPLNSPVNTARFTLHDGSN